MYENNLVDFLKAQNVKDSSLSSWRAALGSEVKLRTGFRGRPGRGVRSILSSSTPCAGGGCAALETAWLAVTGIQVGVPGDHRVTSARQRREQSSEPQGTLAAKAEAEPGRTTR